MNVIFLDIDGVLNTGYSGKDKYGSLFVQDYVNNLKRLIDETNAKIVISSTWRFRGLEEIKEIWEYRELPGEIIDVTIDCFQVIEEGRGDFSEKVERGYEIQDWLDSNKVDNYIIIDDVDDFLLSQKRNLILTSNNINHEDSFDIGYGLTKICTNNAIRILNR